MCAPQTLSPTPHVIACQGTCDAAQKAACPLLAMMAKLDMPLRQKPIGDLVIPAFRSPRKPAPAPKARYGRPRRRPRQMARARRSPGFARRSRQALRA